jgi:hypothetical protein
VCDVMCMWKQGGSQHEPCDQTWHTLDDWTQYFCRRCYTHTHTTGGMGNEAVNERMMC